MSDDYLLGHSPGEHERLRAQHAVWRDALWPVLERCGLRGGARVLDAGCGNGVLLADLAAATGPESVVGIERDPAAVEAARRAVPAATVRQGDLRTVDLGGPYDLVVIRWVLSFLPQVEQVVGRLVEALRPGGWLVAQDYQHDGLRLFPERAAVWRVIEAARAAYAETGGDLWVAGRLPGIYAAAGLEGIEVEPAVQAGPPGSLPFAWVERFLHEHLGTWVRGGHLEQGEAEAFRAVWAEVKATPGAMLFTPIVATVVGQRS